MKKIIYCIPFAAILFLTGCNEDFLDTKNLYEKSLDNFYSTPTEINEAMSGVYLAMYTKQVTSNEEVVANLLDDNMLAGGGTDDKAAKDIDGFVDPTEDTYLDLWRESYNGIVRANGLIERLPLVDLSQFYKTPEEAADFKNQALGEAYFMRGFFEFRLAKFFGGAPLILSSEADRWAPRASYSETYAQIAADFKMAIETMPSTPFYSIPQSEYGHANKWVVEAYLARAFLYYTGYMTNIEGIPTSTLPVAGGAELTKSDILGYLNDCIDNSGYQLASDFRNLWPYSYANTSAGSEVLPWATTEALSWVGQDGHSPTFGTGNNESMFVTRYSTTIWEKWESGNTIGGQQYNNRYCLFSGIRDNSMVPFGQGWGWGTVHPKLWGSWPAADKRKEGSILEMGNAQQGTGSFISGKGDHETGFYNKKYTTIQHNGADGVKGMFYYLYDMNNADPMQLWAAQDFILMRFADVLLMHSEISETADKMNLVRGRAGLPAISYSLSALKEERKYEFEFEALRWFDLVRWGDVNTAYNGSVDVKNYGVNATYSVTYRPETKGLLPIPESEVRLFDGSYTQNPGW